MKFTYNWLKDFVDIKIPAQALAEKFTMSGLEVTSLEAKEGDYIFEVEVTSNRPDWLSVVGIAREAAAITGKKMKLGARYPVPGTRYPSEHRSLQIKIEDSKDCPLYTAKIIKGVKVNPSPGWLKKRLEFIGCRSINNIVDITNYVLFTFGEPLHAFDLDKLDSEVIMVRRAASAEKITAIDGLEKPLDKQILVISDTRRPLAIAGVMGGKDSEVGDKTKNILLEAAVFNPVVVRHARQKLGMQTDSSYRFERGLDIKTAESAAWEAVKLIQELAGGKIICAMSNGRKEEKKRMIELDTAAVNKILGLAIPAAKTKTTLSHLGFQFKSKKKNIFTVVVPSNRQDIKLEIDLIEEIARIVGYDKIPSTLPSVKPYITLCATRELTSFIKAILIGLGSQEVITYSLINKDLLKGINLPEATPIEILNPLSKEQEILRPTLIPSLGRAVAYNLNHKQDYINIFEIAKIFSKQDSQPKEKLALAIAVCGIKSDVLAGRGAIKENLGALHVKGMLEIVFERLGIEDYGFKMAHGNQVNISIGREKVGIIDSLSAGALSNLDIKNKEVWVSELLLENILPYAKLKKKFKEPPIYPAISRDISFILKDNILAEDVIAAIKKNAPVLLKEARVVDYYKGKQIPSGYKSLTISCLYQLDTRTLTEAEVDPVHAVVTSLLVEELSAQIRD